MIKARPASPRIAGCVAVQEHLARAGFPCPEPLTVPETAIVGLAAAVWPAAGAPGEAASVAQNAEFIAGYQLAAGRQWTGPEVADAWAAGLWVRLFNAKKDAADGGGPQLDRLAGEISDRLALAALASG